MAVAAHHLIALNVVVGGEMLRTVRHSHALVELAVLPDVPTGMVPYFAEAVGAFARGSVTTALVAQLQRRRSESVGRGEVRGWLENLRVIVPRVVHNFKF